MADQNQNDLAGQFKTLVGGMSLAKRASLLLMLVLAVAVPYTIYQLSTQSRFETLFSNLKTEDISQIAAALEKMNVPYQIQSESQTIAVPSEKVLDVRLGLAEQGLPRFGGVGFEIFDQKSFGMTEFEQRLNYQRALQGELMRTINEVAGVDDTRVHLVIPEKSIFAQSREEPSASVVVKLSSGQKLTETAVQSIVHLVSASVPNLNAKRVTVVDTTGQMLTANEGEDGVASYKKKDDVEHNYEDKVLALLEPIVGPGKVKVQITADLDFTSKETTEEKYDPETISVRSEKHTKVTEKSGSAGGSGGAVGGTGGGSGGGSGSQKDKTESNDSVDYEISKQIQHIVSPTGELKKLSVAVVVDGIYNVDEEGKTQYTARTAEELKNYEDLIKSAIGFQTDRGDQLKVMNLAFQNLDELFAKNSSTFWQELMSDKATYAMYLKIISQLVIAVVVLLLIVFVIKPMFTAYLARRQAELAAANNAEKLNLERQRLMQLQQGQMKDELQKQAMSDPENMVNILRNWLA